MVKGERHDSHFVDVVTGLTKRVGGLCIYHTIKYLGCDVNKWKMYNTTNDVELQVVEFQHEKARNVLRVRLSRNVQLVIWLP